MRVLLMCTSSDRGLCLDEPERAMANETFHDGELFVQARAGVTDRAAKLLGMFQAEIPPAARAFLAEREMLVIGSVAASGAIWASRLAAAPGFIRAVDQRVVRIDAAPAPGDPLAEVLRPGAPPAPVGLLAIDLETRRRMRLNGTARRSSGGEIDVEAHQVYSNCPKYIQARSVRPLARERRPSLVSDADTLSDAQRRWIDQADTFFIATAHPQAGVDASHRGGNPGFVRVNGADRICFPDYAGNNMFNTLGNIAVNPAAGLLFVDFESGRTLQVCGEASVAWDGNRAASGRAPARHVVIRVSRVIETAGALPHAYDFVEPSPVNPPVEGFCSS